MFAVLVCAERICPAHAAKVRIKGSSLLEDCQIKAPTAASDVVFLMACFQAS